jgi:hypothetical protein
MGKSYECPKYSHKKYCKGLIPTIYLCFVEKFFPLLQYWLRETYGYVKHYQYYLNEYCLRYNRNKMKKEYLTTCLIE